ncbi:uncharacterized protein LOC124926842 [Impatiens glandulifera]|uniref:uncharacterized protein LOC124926842 n=1 Tax=Impatiens glandulifera TaxID=253017 RepID=UPI001FB0511B|nr:uncharacterized protein LOC124926842 [Impatiens glandulifera]
MAPPHESALAISFPRLRPLSLPIISFSLRDHSGSGEEESHKALETVLKLYTAIRKRNIIDISDIIAKECRCISNLISSPQKFNGKQQVLNFFNSLMMSLGNSNIEFVVQPTIQDGLTIGVSWKLECKNTHIPVGEGFSFHICHVYQGKVVIRNVEMFFREPIEPLQMVRNV